MKPRMPNGIAEPVARLAAILARGAASALMLVSLLPAPALAAPAHVSGMTYDESRRQISVDLAGTVSVRTQRIKNPDRLVIDLNEARLPLGEAVPVIQPRGSRIRSVRMGQHTYVPPVVRLVVDLIPGFEPMVTINQTNGKLLITLANPTPPQGERDLESLPAFPLQADAPARLDPPFIPPADAPIPGTVTRMPAPAPLPVPPVVPTPRPVWTPPPVPGWVSRPTPTPTPGEPPSGPPPVVPDAPRPTPMPPGSGMPPDAVRPWSPPSLPTPTPTPAPSAAFPASPVPGDTRAPGETPAPSKPSSEPAEAEAESPEIQSVLPPERRPAPGLGSSFQLRWQQIETLEDYGGPEPSFAYPAGINGFDFEHWFMPYVGAGFDARVLFYDLSVERVRQHRTDAMLGSFLALRYPLGFLEPSLRAGYMGRSVTVESEMTGTTVPFSPLQTYYGPSLTGRLKVTLLPGLGLDLHGKLLPSTRGALYPGFPSIYPLSGTGWGASLVTDILGGYVSLGYNSEHMTSSDDSFKQTFSGITLGIGMRY